MKNILVAIMLFSFAGGSFAAVAESNFDATEVSSLGKDKDKKKKKCKSDKKCCKGKKECKKGEKSCCKKEKDES